MTRDLEGHRADFLAACEHIRQFTEGLGDEAFLENVMARRAVEREFEILGEILRRMAADHPDAFAAIPDARRVIDFRNVLAHGYDVVDPLRVLRIARTSLLRVEEAVRGL